MRAFVRSRDPVTLLAELQGAATDIARLVPELRERWPSELPALPLDDEQARFRLFDSVTTLLTRVAHTATPCADSG